jgi:hypothetical protein
MSRGAHESTTSATYPRARNQSAHSRVDADTPWQPCSRITAGKGPRPPGRTSTAGIRRGVPGVALGKDTAGVAQAASKTEAAIATKAWRGMRRAYTGRRV